MIDAIINFFLAIADFFVMIGKGIVIGIVSFFKGIWWVLKTIGIAIFKVVVYVLGLLVSYFPVYFPVLIIGGYVLMWVTGAMYKLDTEIHGLWDFFHYDYELTGGLVGWLENTEHNFFSAITLGLVQVALIAVTAVLETLIVYVIFFGVGSIIIMAIQFILWMAFLFALPAAAVVFDGIMLKNSRTSNLWFHILMFASSIVLAVIHYIYLFSAL